MLICGIYKITNQTNGKCYIGQSVNIKRRWRSHKTKAFNSSDIHIELFENMDQKIFLLKFQKSVLKKN